uniref:Uncharacterized protein n=1 Tax=Anguilla anguilla TaxID=7936 RepID=A0A0E9P837_ANGAN
MWDPEILHFHRVCVGILQVLQFPPQSKDIGTLLIFQHVFMRNTSDKRFISYNPS